MTSNVQYSIFLTLCRNHDRLIGTFRPMINRLWRTVQLLSDLDVGGCSVVEHEIGPQVLNDVSPY